MITNFKYLKPIVVANVPWNSNECYDSLKNNNQYKEFKAIFGRLTWEEFEFNLNWYFRNDKIITVRNIQLDHITWVHGSPQFNVRDRLKFDLSIYQPI
jgi:hypothetical protein